MKRFILLFMASMLCFVSCYDDTELRDSIQDLDNRVDKLELLCSQMNTNISSMQTLLEAVLNNDYVTGVTPIILDGKEVGYTITFTKSKPVTIYHGKNGADGKPGQNGQPGQPGTDGQNGQNGADGHSPVIGVKLDSNGIYYWTLDGEWLLDDNGNKIKAVGTDGADGKPGQEGTDGKPGANGQDGITPELKIEEGYWYVRYGEGQWKQLGKATGENGQNGSTFFSNVVKDGDYLVLTLTDGTDLKIPFETSNIVKRIQSILYVPQKEDGSAVMSCTYQNGAYLPGTSRLSFEIFPHSLSEELANSSTLLQVQAIYANVSTIQPVNLPLKEVSVNNGLLTLLVSGENLSQEFYRGKTFANLRLCVTDGNNRVSSDYISIKAEPDIFLSASTTSFDVVSHGAQIELSVQHSLEYEFSVDVDWISEISVRTQSSQEDTWKFDIAPNNTGKERNAQITFQSLNASIKVEVSVSQKSGTNQIETMIDIPDVNLRAYVLGLYDKNKDGAISDTEADSITILNLNNLSIRSLEGIDKFKNLKKLYSQGNYIENLTLNNHKNLAIVVCDKIQNINLQGCTSLNMLNCTDQDKDDHGRTLRIDVHDCSSLRSLSCANNKITRIDASGCGLLEVMDCALNNLSSVTLAGCRSLMRLDVSCSYATGTTRPDGNNPTMTTLDIRDCTQINWIKVAYSKVTEIIVRRGLDVSKVSVITATYANKPDFTFVD